jgi:alpha-galactosidase
VESRPIISELKIAYLGGGSREWARQLMIDLALCPELGGHVALYDIDREAAALNEQLGNWLQEQPGVVSRWRYEVAPVLEEAVRGLRSATLYAEFARVLAAICPRAWIINYTNPLTICPRTLTRVAPALKVFGCCHEVYATQRMLAGVVKQSLDVTPTRAQIKVNVLGLNHFTWNVN